MDEKAALIEFRNIPTPRRSSDRFSARVQAHDGQGAQRRDANVVMDVCHPCAKAWLDGGEIAAIQTDSLAASVANLFRWVRAVKSKK